MDLELLHKSSHLGKFILHITEVSQDALRSLVTFSAEDLVAIAAETPVQAFAGASLGGSGEVRHGRLELLQLALRNIEAWAKCEVSVLLASSLLAKPHAACFALPELATQRSQGFFQLLQLLLGAHDT